MPAAQPLAEFPVSDPERIAAAIQLVIDDHLVLCAPARDRFPIRISAAYVFAVDSAMPLMADEVNARLASLELLDSPIETSSDPMGLAGLSLKQKRAAIGHAALASWLSVAIELLETAGASGLRRRLCWLSSKTLANGLCDVRKWGMAAKSRFCPPSPSLSVSTFIAFLRARRGRVCLGGDMNSNGFDEQGRANLDFALIRRADAMSYDFVGLDYPAAAIQAEYDECERRLLRSPGKAYSIYRKEYICALYCALARYVWAHD